MSLALIKKIARFLTVLLLSILNMLRITVSLRICKVHEKVLRYVILELVPLAVVGLAEGQPDLFVVIDEAKRKHFIGREL